MAETPPAGSTPAQPHKIMTAIQQAAQAMGRAKSPAKTQAARENGKKGGRPRRPPNEEKATDLRKKLLAGFLTKD